MTMDMIVHDNGHDCPILELVGIIKLSIQI